MTAATVTRTVDLASPAEAVWDAVRDFHNVHVRVAPGFVTALEAEPGARLITFWNGLVARETLVERNDRARRLRYAIPEGRFDAYEGRIEVAAAGEGTRLTWTVTLEPEAYAPFVAESMDRAVPILKTTLEA